jgi:hypothetical protein
MSPRILSRMSVPGNAGSAGGKRTTGASGDVGVTDLTGEHGVAPRLYISLSDSSHGCRCRMHSPNQRSLGLSLLPTESSAQGESLIRHLLVLAHRVSLAAVTACPPGAPDGRSLRRPPPLPEPPSPRTRRRPRPRSLRRPAPLPEPWVSSQPAQGSQPSAPSQSLPRPRRA